MSNRCVQTASHLGWHEKRQTALIPADPLTASLLTKWCALTLWPLLIIEGLIEPLETLLIGPQTFQGWGLMNDGCALARTVPFRPIGSFNSQPQAQAGG